MCIYKYIYSVCISVSVYLGICIYSKIQLLANITYGHLLAKSSFAIIGSAFSQVFYALCS